MTEFSLPYVSVASSGGEYFQVSFAESEDGDGAYFLVQRQFETDDGGLIYIESHEPKLCGHFKVGRAELERDTFRLEVACEPAETVQISFQANDARYNELKHVLKIMIPRAFLSLSK